MRTAVLLLLVAAAHAGDERWFGGIRQLAPGQYLDLDNGGLFASAEPFPGGKAELAGERFCAEAEEDPAFAALAPALSRAPWTRVVTSDGNTSWVQRLRSRPTTVFHFLTRLGGEGVPAPCPRAPLAIGRTYSIELRYQSPCRIRLSIRIA